MSYDAGLWKRSICFRFTIMSAVVFAVSFALFPPTQETDVVVKSLGGATYSPPKPVSESAGAATQNHAPALTAGGIAAQEQDAPVSVKAESSKNSAKHGEAVATTQTGAQRTVGDQTLRATGAQSDIAAQGIKAPPPETQELPRASAGSKPPAAQIAPGASISAVAPNPELKTASDVPGILIGRKFTHEFPFGGRNVPLMAGEWTVIQAMRSTSRPDASENVALAQWQGRRLSGLIVLAGQRLHTENSTGFRKYERCDQKNFLHVERVSNEDFGRQECWIVNYAISQRWPQSDTASLRNIAANLAIRGVDVPYLMIAAVIRSADRNHVFVGLYYLNPESEDIQTTPAQPDELDWNRRLIVNFPDKVAYIERVKLWVAGNWQRLSAPPVILP